MSGAIIDDSDPAVIYSGKWAANSGWSDAYEGTIHASTTLNDKATLTFQGTGILVNSGQEGVGWRVRSSYSIDSGNPTVFGSDSYQSTMQAYQSPALPNGLHTLTVINLDNRTLALFLDSFIVFAADDSASTTTPSTTTVAALGAFDFINSSSSFTTSSSGARTSTSSLPAISATTQPLGTSSTPSPRPPPNSSDSNQIPLIVGPILGAIVVCGIIYGLFLLRRRRKDQIETDSRITYTLSYLSVPAVRFMPRWDGRKPSSLIRNPNDPPPYIESPQSSSYPISLNRQPAKFRR